MQLIQRTIAICCLLAFLCALYYAEGQSHQLDLFWRLEVS
jgi:hypothetical protein